MRLAWGATLLGVLVVGCTTQPADSRHAAIDAAARAYVRLALALGERDSDSLDSYHGPPAWQSEVRSERATLAQIHASAAALARSLRSREIRTADEETRRAFLVRQLDALGARVEVLQGARPSFEDESVRLFGIEVPKTPAHGAPEDEASGAAAARTELDRLLPGRGDLAARFAAFERRFLIEPDRLPAVFARAVAGCREATRTHGALPDGERVEIEYVRELPWSAFTRYQGRFVSRVQVNAALPLTVDRALDLACHETYPGHHAIALLLDSQYGDRRPEFFVLPMFSPQSALHEAASSLAPALAFPDAARTTFERDELFPLAGLDPALAAGHVAAERLVDRLHTIEADVARKYLDGILDFPRAAAALERDALMPSADATLKFLNQFRGYAATYTIGRDLLERAVGADWTAYRRAVTSPEQRLPGGPK
jgi:hypothetical protein